MSFFIEFTYEDNLIFERISKLINYVKKKKDLNKLDCDDPTILDFYN
ncbi:hypothetical protein [Clostridium senegalense]|uniref:Uncharacterized protein n=2 Tax=Clostridium TaxID=1485 RepID=A0A6M0H4G8_9CLOT|nr:hypothetical protein [Clostridium senegalense]NEU05499.1 hypothetical protein [Clostridium senegalense]